jgi:hypothetical protein
MKMLMLVTALMMTTFTNTFAGNPFLGDSAKVDSENTMSYNEAFETASDFVREEMNEMKKNYRFIRAFDRDEQTYMLFAQDKLGKSVYVLVGVDKKTGTSFTMGVD